MSAHAVPTDPLQDLVQQWTGRALLERELLGLDAGKRQALEAALAAAASGLAEIVPAVAREGLGWRCARCGGSAVRHVPCSRCGRWACPFCEECAPLGPARGCERLFRFPLPPGWAGPLQPRRPGALPYLSEGTPDPWPRFPFPLTPAQEAVAERLKEWVLAAGGPESMLLWAACGAGKTEILLSAAAAVVRAGGRVLVAAPRREVVRELAPRVRAAVDPVPVAAWYGGSEPARDRPDPRAPLVVATTHQALRFYRAFHLVAVDELDAFPFRDHEVLRRAVDRAALPGARRLWVTATPPGWLRRQVRAPGRKRCGVVFLPARPHGHPLPEPRFLWDPRLGAWRNLKGWPGKLVAWLKAGRERGARLLVFVPTVDLARELVRPLSRILDEEVGALWAGHPRRDVELERFRQGQVGVLVSTSVLERGVTLPAVDVAVLFPEHPVFDEATLVQMAGRAGRSLEDPHGRVLFAGVRPSWQVVMAAAAIRAMNRRAARAGLLAGAPPRMGR
ncbi:MAG TPA: DEAD/DEAH box helicase [Limnochorda sp.]